MSILVGATSGLAGAAGAAGGGGDLGDTIDQSLRFNNGPNVREDYLQNTNITIQATSTFSGWVKIGGEHGATKGPIFGASKDSTSADNATALGVTDDGRFYSRNTSGDQFWDNRFRDYSAWYHVVLQFDSSRNMTLFVNGVEQSSTKSPINVGSEIIIGRNRTGSADEAFQGYMAALYYVDGSILAPTSFGKYNEDDVWVPQDYTGSYGTNGFKLVFDSSAGIGDDSSGNGNDFTASGFDTTAISSSNEDNDIDYEDTPTSNYATLNPLNTKVSGTTSISNSNLRISATSTSGYIDAQSTIAASEFDCYCEATIIAKDLLGIGVGDITAAIATGIGSYIVWRESGDVIRYPGNVDIETVASYDVGDTIGMTITSTQVAFYKNGTLQGTYSHSLTGDFYAIGMAYNNGSTATMDFNFGQMPFIHTVPTGFSALQTNNLPEPTIKNGREHFEALLYTGDGVDSHAIPGLDFQPDLVWIKPRSVTDNHRLMDSIRGVSTHLVPNSADDEPTTNTQILESFDSGGFTLNGTDAGWNGNTSTYVAWCWKAGGTAVSNTDGTITSSVSANTDAGFSIVSFTGTGANATVGHGLSSPPTFVIIKNRDQDTNWVVGTTALDDFDTGFYLNLSSAKETSGSGFFNGTPPTSSLLHVGDSANTNGSTKKMIAYCWAPVEGYSKFGEFNGNGSSDGPFVYTGFRPAWILFKRNEAANWRIYDTARNPNNMATQILWPHLTDDEDTEPYGTGGGIDFLSNGFKVRDSGTTINNDGTAIYYWAFAEHPFGGENAPPVTAR